MKVCILQPESSQITGELERYSLHGFPQHFSDLLPEDEVDFVVLKKATIYRQLKQLKKQNYDVFVNLCRGFRDDDSASCHEITAALEELNLPYTGSASVLYDAPKAAMKHIAYYGGVETPSFAVAATLADARVACHDLSFPLFVKPIAATDCVGVDSHSYITTQAELESKVSDIINQCDSAFIEEYIAGREFTVLVAADPTDPDLSIAYPPVEVLLPEKQPFQTHQFRIGANGSCYVACSDQQLDLSLRQAAQQLFAEINQGGYACFDFRVDAAGEIFFLDVNSPCSIFNPETSKSVADYILQINGISQAEFLQQAIAEGIARHQRRQKKYQVKKSPIATYGIFAAQNLQAGEVVVSGENQLQKVVTRSYARSRWTPAQQKTFLRYTHPLSEEVFVLRDPNNPAAWLLQNHSCDPNTAYKGLNLIALTDIAGGDELTVDFATFLDESGLEFECQCGSPKCRGLIRLDPCCSSKRWQEQDSFYLNP